MEPVDAVLLDEGEKIALPVIKETRLVSPRANEGLTRRYRPRSSGSKPFFPRVRKFSHESQEKLKELEKGFILDGVVLSRLTNEETARTHPSINIGIPQYRATEDKHCSGYFSNAKALPKNITPEPMIGKVEDKFFKSTEASYYLKDRLEKGTCYTRRVYGGHLSVPTDPSKDGYNGPEGYRRNTFDLRRQPSVFDYEDPFENPKPINRRMLRSTQSAPATMKLFREKSATAYRSSPAPGLVKPAGKRKAMSAMPTLTPVPEISTTLTPVPEIATN